MPLKVKAARYRQRFDALKGERTTWADHWRLLAEYILPRRGRFNVTDHKSAGSVRSDKINNNTATRAARIGASGLQAGLTNPSQVWLTLRTADPELNERRDVKIWLADVVRKMLDVFARSNLYTSLASDYHDLLVFCTSALYVEEDDADAIRTEVWPIGSYVIAYDDRKVVSTVFHEVTMTVEQIVQRWGTLDKDGKAVRAGEDQDFGPSNRVVDLYNGGDYDEAIEVTQVIEPNRDRVRNERGDPLLTAEGKPYLAYWYETQSKDGQEERFLGRRGYDEFPVMVSRWSVNGEDVWGTGPGMEALGDIKALQKAEYDRAKALAKIVDPPMKASASMAAMKKTIASGKVTLVTDGTGLFEPSVKVDPRALAIKEWIDDVVFRINGTFFADMFLLLTSNSQPDRTAREVAELHQEKMLQLGPVLQRLEDEKLDPLIDRTFNIMLRRGMIDPPPQAMEGMELRVEYVSVLADAQKLVSTVPVERLLGLVTSASETWPDAPDKIDIDQTIDKYADFLGADPSLVRDEEAVGRMRAERAASLASQEAQQATQTAATAAGAAKDLSQADLTNDTALARMLSAVGGPGATPVEAQA